MPWQPALCFGRAAHMMLTIEEYEVTVEAYLADRLRRFLYEIAGAALSSPNSSVRDAEAAGRRR
jgi:hypothetical protein